MKEFLFGGLISIWFVLLGISAINMTLTVLSILYPLVLGLLVGNYFMIKRIFQIYHKRSMLAHK